MSMSISGYSFNVGNLDFDISHNQALRLYNYLESTRMFGIDMNAIKIDTDTDINFSIRTNICLDDETSFLDLDLIELKELYYLLHKLFKDAVSTKR